MLTTRTTIPWTGLIAVLLALVAIALLCTWQSDAVLQIGIRAALLVGGVATVLLLDREGARSRAALTTTGRRSSRDGC